MSALNKQIGGNHYRDLVIQPAEFCEVNGLSFCAGNVVKYVIRHSLKGGREDLEKARHYVDLMIAIHYPGTPDEPSKASIEAGQKVIRDILINEGFCDEPR